MRIVRLFNEGWLFAPEKLDLDASDDVFEPITLPHTNRPFSHRHVDAHAYQFISTYRKRFRLLDQGSGQRVYLDFDGAMLVSTVLVNDRQVGIHGGGYTPFSFDITDYLVKGENVLTVFLDSTDRLDVPPYGHLVDYLPFGGIYRDVYLRMVDPCHIVNIFARPQNVLTAPQLECDIQLSKSLDGLEIEGVLVDEREEPVACARQVVKGKSVTLSFPETDQVDLWTLDRPSLYSVVISLSQNSKAIDEKRVRFGFRSAEFRKDGGFYLNGERVKLFGLNRHQTYPYIGAAAPARLQRQDAEILKYELSCNIVRTSHYPQSSHFLDRCDEIGLLVFEEIPGWQHIGDNDWQSLTLRDVCVMIERDRNHPSIILWGTRINESPDQFDLYTRTNALAHELDPTRQTGGARDFIDSAFLEDVFTFNDYSSGIQQPRFQPHLITEFGGHMFPTKIWDHEERRIEHASIHVRKHNLQMGRDDIAGAIGWCAFDYNTHREFGSGDRICHHGVMDIFRLPKWAAYFYQSQQPPSRKIVLQAATHWTMGDRSGGGNNPLTIFSNCEEVEVFEGSQKLGRFQPDRDQYPHLAYPPITIRWPEPYNPWGRPFEDLTILGYIDHKVVAEQKIATDHLPHGIGLSADVDCLKADGSDMTRLVVKLRDRFGNVLPYHLKVITFEVNGEIDLIGENPLPLVGGQAACYIKSRHVAGTAKITARTADLPPASTVLRLEG